MAAHLRVELDAVTENTVHDTIKGHEGAPEKMVGVKGDVHIVGMLENHGGGKVRRGGAGHEMGRGLRNHGECATVVINCGALKAQEQGMHPRGGELTAGKGAVKTRPASVRLEGAEGGQSRGDGAAHSR